MPVYTPEEIDKFTQKPLARSFSAPLQPLRQFHKDLQGRETREHLVFSSDHILEHPDALLGIAALNDMVGGAVSRRINIEIVALKAVKIGKKHIAGIVEIKSTPEKIMYGRITLPQRLYNLLLA